MITCNLTTPPFAAKGTRTVRRANLKQSKGVRSVMRAMAMAGLGLGVIPMLGGCVNVSAPDKPIVIELNINIRQEVIYRLAADAANTIEENPEIF